MNVFFNFMLFTTSYLIQLVIFIFGCYYLSVTFIGWRPLLLKPIKGNRKKHRFALIIPAHNEEKVISQIISSLNYQNYPREYFDIFIIADNCKDHTADIVSTLGVTVLERHNEVEKGKGYALEWAFQKIFGADKKYDAICVFDADNLVSDNFLTEMNHHLNMGQEVIQGYIDSKNPYDSWISCSYSLAFWLSNRVFQEPRYNLTLSSGLCGTGFCIRTEVLEEIGWGATCLTEDLEFTMKLVLNKKKVCYAKKAVVFDEKPLTLKQSWRQRKRWMQGHADCARKYLLPLLTSAFKEKNITAFDCAIYLFQPIRFIFFGLATVMTWLQSFFPTSPIYIIGYAFPVEVWYTIVLLQFLYGPIIVLIEKRFNWKTLLGFAIYPLYCLTWLPIAVQGMLDVDKKEWDHTMHTRNISIQEVENK